MKKAKKKYNVYLRQIIDTERSEADDIRHEIFIRSTYAVSEKQAETNVRFGNKDKYNSYFDEHQTVFYHAIESESDIPSLHDGWTLPIFYG